MYIHYQCLATTLPKECLLALTAIHQNIEVIAITFKSLPKCKFAKTAEYEKQHCHFVSFLTSENGWNRITNLKQHPKSVAFIKIEF